MKKNENMRGMSKRVCLYAKSLISPFDLLVFYHLMTGIMPLFSLMGKDNMALFNLATLSNSPET
jgi:hypothetical protein